jgi:hypothetical protein
MLLLRLGFFGRLVSYLFSFNHVFSFKVLGIFALVCDKNSNRHKAWERCTKLASPTRYLHNKFSGYFFGFKRERNFASSLSIENRRKFTFKRLTTYKDLAKLVEKNDKVNIFFLLTLNPKKIEPKNPIIDFV